MEWKAYMFKDCTHCCIYCVPICTHMYDVKGVDVVCTLLKVVSFSFSVA